MPGIEVGDVSTIPIDGGRVGVGRVVLDFEYEHHMYFRVFRESYPVDDPPPAADEVNGELAFLALSMDALPPAEPRRVRGRSTRQARGARACLERLRTERNRRDCR